MAALLSGQWRLFDQWYLAPRPSIPRRAQEYIDRTLFVWKMKTLTDADMRYKAEGQTYTAEEVERSRLVLKNNNGLVFLSEHFLEIYPDATFFALVRHPLPLYESHKRRRTPPGKSPEAFAHFYTRMAQQMLIDANRLPRYYVVRFEDILKEPIGMLRQLYDWADLDFGKIRKVRFKAKPHFRSNGTYGTKYQVGRHYWFTFSEVTSFLQIDINKYQSTRLSREERESIMAMTNNVCQQLGYIE
jgi:hypothetical protein